MKVSELIEKLKEYNPDATVDVVVGNAPYEFSLWYGVPEGSTKKTATEVSFNVDALYDNDFNKK